MDFTCSFRIFPHVLISLLLKSFCGYLVVGLRGLQIVFLFGAFVCPYLPCKPCFGLEHVRFQSPAYVWRRSRVFSGYIGARGFSWLGWFMCVLALLPVWYYGMKLTSLSSVLLLLSACNMARGQEETSTSQAGRRRGPGGDTPSASSIISSLSMEELRSYCHIPDNIDLEFPDGPAESTIDEEDDAVYFTRE